MSRHQRPTPATFTRHTCDICHAVYYVHAAVALYIDTGRCVSCDNEILSLETWLNSTPAPVEEGR